MKWWLLLGGICACSKSVGGGGSGSPNPSASASVASASASASASVASAAIPASGQRPTPEPLPDDVPPATFERKAFLPQGCPHVERGLGAWTAIDPARLSQNQIVALGYTGCEWSVTLSDGLIVPASQKESEPPDTSGLQLAVNWGVPSQVQRRPQGILVGFNNGEWGGALRWYSPAGAFRGKLLSENIVDIVPGVDRSIVLAGFAHLGAEYGKAIELVETETQFNVGRSAALNSPPCVAVRERTGALLIATNRTLLRLGPDFSVSLLLEAHWHPLYPNSIVVDAAGTAYLGMRSVLARVTPINGGYREEWLIPPRPPG